MARSAVTVDINDPYEITPTMWDLFTPTPTSAITPPQFLARTYQAGDWRKYQIDGRPTTPRYRSAKLARSVSCTWLIGKRPRW